MNILGRIKLFFMLPSVFTHQFKIIVCLVIFSFGFNVSLAESERYGEINVLIQENADYPREALYYLPASLPSDEYSSEQNLGFSKLGQAMLDKGLVSLKPAFSGTKILPRENTFDVLKQDINSKYQLLGLNLVLGVWDVQVKVVEKNQGITIVTGDRVLREPTRIFKLVTGILSREEIARFVKKPMQWTILNKGNRLIVEESSPVQQKQASGK